MLEVDFRREATASQGLEKKRVQKSLTQIWSRRESLLIKGIVLFIVFMVYCLMPSMIRNITSNYTDVPIGKFFEQ